MSTTDLVSLLPGVHASFAGVFFAFFTAFVIYAYQKISATRDEIDEFISNLKPRLHVYFKDGDAPELKCPDDYFKEIKRISQSVRFDYGFSKEDTEKQLKDISKAVSYFEAIISHINNELGFIPKIDSFDENTYQNSYKIFRENYSRIMKYWTMDFPWIIQTYPALNEHLKRFLKDEAEAELRDNMSKYGWELSKEVFDINVKQTVDRARWVLDPKKIENLENSIKLFDDYYQGDFVVLQMLIEKKSRLKEKYKLYETSEKVFYWLFIPVLVFGIIIPFILIAKAYCLKDSLFLSFGFQLFLVVISFIPYLGFSLWGLSKLKSEIHKQ
ncbi:hypothetical protein Q5X39_08155 [Acinetobacter baumannii]|uniref:hypothetical protein n=1 Tax=Acinetobacter baumannii TaxID=470 RepID=UPI002702DAD5|nr:hypothetical protein [Acinetobacter baumannii]